MSCPACGARLSLSRDGAARFPAEMHRGECGIKNNCISRRSSRQRAAETHAAGIFPTDCVVDRMASRMLMDMKA